MKLQRIVALFALVLVSACGPAIDKQYTNRQIAYVDIQPGPKANPMQVERLRSYLQPALIQKLQGRGQPPAVGVTVVITGFDMPGQFADNLLGPGSQSAGVGAEVQLWDATTHAPLTKFLVMSGAQARTETLLGETFGYVNGHEPEDISQTGFYPKLAQAVTYDIIDTMYGAN